MGEDYFHLKNKLEDLGYNNNLPFEAVPLVECMLADLLQTTRSLQGYMDISKDAINKRESLLLESEAYRNDNTKLIQENNQLHREVMNLKEENLKQSKELQRKIKTLNDEIVRKENCISKLQQDIRDMSLRGLCTETLSSRNRIRRKDTGDGVSKPCKTVQNSQKSERALEELTQKLYDLEESNGQYYDEIMLLKDQLNNRDGEIIRLSMLLENGRKITPTSTDNRNCGCKTKVETLLSQICDLEVANDSLKKELNSTLSKQHEAMSRALDLADKYKSLQEEMKKVDGLALRVEDDCNARLAIMQKDANNMQTRIDSLNLQNSNLQKELSQVNQNSAMLQQALKEKDMLQQEINNLMTMNKNLQDKIFSQTQVTKDYQIQLTDCKDKYCKKYPTKDELQILLEEERKKYEKHILNLQDKLSETVNLVNKHVLTGKTNKDIIKSPNATFVKDLHIKLCESEQKILMLKKENDELNMKFLQQEEYNKLNNKDVVSQLNSENAELSKENILLCQQLSLFRNLASSKPDSDKRNKSQKLQTKIEELAREIKILSNDKHEYHMRYKEAIELTDKLKRDLALKQKEVDQLEEENRSYKITNRTGVASADRMREECQFLREQIKRMQTDVIKEKTMASQVKNIQLETERNSAEVQNELLSTQKKLNLSKDTIVSLEKKCQYLESEIKTLKSDKSKLIDNIKQMDLERDKLVLDLDNKTENLNVLEQKLKSQSYEISKLENEVSGYQRKLNSNKIIEHKLVDYESQMSYLNGEVVKLTQQLDSATIENKHLQNSLADVNGMLKLTKVEHEKSKREVDSLKQQLQHYVTEIRRIEEMLSHKEAERSDMLEQFASLSVEANILENTNQSLESESASKSIQLQSYVNKIQNLEEKLLEKESIIDSQAARISAMACKMSSIENETKLITEEKNILEQNVSYLKQMCNNMQQKNSIACKDMSGCDSEIKLYENRIKHLSSTKCRLEAEKLELVEKLTTTEKLLSNARKDIVELKLTLQDATSETQSLQDHVNILSKRNLITQEILPEEVEPLMLEEISEDVLEDHQDSEEFYETRNRLSKFSHSSTL